MGVPTGAIATKEGGAALGAFSSGLLKPAAMALLNAIKYTQAEGGEGDDLCCVRCTPMLCHVLHSRQILPLLP